MSSVPPNTDAVSYENALEREKARQQRHMESDKLSIKPTANHDRPVRDDNQSLVPQGTRKRTRPVKPPISNKQKKSQPPPQPHPTTPPPPSPMTPTLEDVWTAECSETLEQLLTQLPSYEEEVTLQVPENTPTCPFHQVSLEYHVSKKGWPYVKCSQQPCIFFTSQEELVPYLDGIRHQRHPALIFGQGGVGQFPSHLCWCHEPLSLKTSRSEKNPGRMFLGCRNRKCDYFQWLNCPWSKRLLEEQDQRAREMQQYRANPTPPPQPTWYDGRAYPPPIQPVTPHQVNQWRDGLLTG